MLDQDFIRYRSWWKRNRTPARGFYKSYKAVTPSGDTLHLDYNFHENLVRLSLEPSNEKGHSYVTTIKSGTIIRERDMFNSQNTSLKKKFLPFKDIFSCISDEDALSSILGVYEIYKPSLENKSVEAKQTESILPQDDLAVEILEGKWKLFYRKFRERFLDDLYDCILGVSLCAALYFHYFDFVVLGFALGFMGVFFGSIDWLMRNRNPLILKVLSFLISGGYYFYTGFTRF
jgi:hypothetical protein